MESNVIDVYARGDERFLHLGEARFQKHLFRGKFIDKYHHSHDVCMNPRKMVSKGWKKLEDPFLSLEEQMLADVQHLVKLQESGSHMMRIGDMIERIGKYASILEIAKDESASRQTR